MCIESHYRAGGCTHAFTEVGDGRDVFDTGKAAPFLITMTTDDSITE